MMPSVIPARLQFQCGHAALVTLPRVKGETATQRNDRVAREKVAALTRQCDFCAPANGSAHVEVADAVETTPVEELAVIVAAQPEPSLEAVEELVVVAEELEVVAEELEALAIAEELVAATEDLETLAAELEAVLPEPEAVLEPVAVALDVLDVPGVTPVNGANGVPAPKTVRKPRARRQRAEMVARGQRFLVEYRLERVLRADSIHEALRQIATYGPGEVVAITRED